MEVHYEPHLKHGHHKKHLAEYAKEFLMIFFAVFLGFLAENLREHITENKREKEYVRGFMADLKKDNQTLKGIIAWSDKLYIGRDSLLNIDYLNITTPEARKQFYSLSIKYFTTDDGFIPTETTLQQIKSSGDMRLLIKKHVSDNLVAYYSDIEQLELTNKTEETFMVDIVNLESKIFDYQYFNRNISFIPDDKLPTIKDVAELRSFFFKAKFLNRFLSGTNAFNKSLLKKNVILIKFLQDTYHLKDE